MVFQILAPLARPEPKILGGFASAGQIVKFGQPVLVTSPDVSVELSSMVALSGLANSLELLGRPADAIPLRLRVIELHDASPHGSPSNFVVDLANTGHSLALIDDPEVFPPGHLMLLQEIITSVDGTISRVEFVDGEFLLAMKVKPQNTFNLCPAEGCPRNPIEAGAVADATFEAWPDVPQDAVAQAREILRAAQLDIGGVEWMDTADGRRIFIDINATSVYREDMQKAVGVDGFQTVWDYRTRELAKEAAKSVFRVPRRLGS